MKLAPITQRAAFAFVAEHHRHHRPPRGALFQVAAEHDGRVVGVVIVGRPVARWLQDGRTAEVTRLCVDGHPNACSKLYAAAWRAAKALGYDRLITYILEDEEGVSLRAAGWVRVTMSGGGSWSRQDRPRVDKHPTCPKQRWEVRRGH